MLKKTKEVLELIANDELFKRNDIRFVGGTALSYLIQHRLSEDLGFASLSLPQDEIIAMIESYGGTRTEYDDTMKDYITNEGGDIDNSYMVFDLNGVKVEFFTPPFNLLEVNIWGKDKFINYEDTTLKVASLETIIYMKTMAFWNRKKYRDVFDVYFILKNGHIEPKFFINNYLECNITYNVENLHNKIQATSEFYEKPTDEGINTLVTEPKSYEWYRTKIENYIYEVLLVELYK
jgi:predicted nucleotidyltransferase component of viral defense system